MSPWAQSRIRREYEGSWLEGSSAQLRFHAATASPDGDWTLPIGRGADQASHIVHCTGNIGIAYGGVGSVHIDRYAVLDDRATCLAFIPSGRLDGPGGYESDRVEEFASTLGLRFSEVKLRTGNLGRAFPGLVPSQRVYTFMAYVVPATFVAFGVWILMLVLKGSVSGTVNSRTLLSVLVVSLCALACVALGVLIWPKSCAKLSASLKGTPNEMPATSPTDEKSPPR